MDPATRAQLVVGARVALAHHPLCSYFEHDVIRIGRARVCSGCALALPALLLGVLAAWLARGLDPFALGAIGLACGAPQLLSYGARRGRLARGATKLVGGFGLGLFLVALWLLPLPLAWRVAGAALLGLSFVALQLVRMRAIWRTCQACPWRARWDECPGFAPPRHDPAR